MVRYGFKILFGITITLSLMSCNDGVEVSSGSRLPSLHKPTKPLHPPKTPPQTKKKPDETHAKTSLTSDAEILRNLKQNLRLVPQDMGDGGRCLFHSLREQISGAELIAVQDLLSNALGAEIAGFADAGENAKANILRRIAIEVERNFFAVNSRKHFIDLSPEDQAWALEMAKDWREELGGDRAKTQRWFSKYKTTENGREHMWRYVKKNREAYWTKSSCETNWAGTTEAIVFARILDRPLKMYGQDVVSSKNAAKLDGNGVVLPYFHYRAASEDRALLVWQVNGGGHYQMLRPEH